MKKIIFCLVILTLTFTHSIYAQYDMGDAELNASLTTIISKGKVQFSEFKSYIMLTYKVPKETYDYWQSEVGMNTGDIYLTTALAKVSKKSFADIVTSYKRNKKQGWAVIAKELGVNSGTPAFETLKDDAYKKANGTARPKPKPTTKPVTKKPATKPAKTTKPKPKTTTKPKKKE
jgi:hypothetical protein